MTVGKLVRGFTVGLLLAILLIGLLPFLFTYLLADVNGLTDIDSTPVYTLVTKFIQGTKDTSLK